MDLPERLYTNTIKNGIFYAQVESRIEMGHHLELDVRSQEEVRVAASIVLMYQTDIMHRNGERVHFITPFQASHAVLPRKVNGRPSSDYMMSPYAMPHLHPEDMRPVLDELLLRGWEHILQEHGYTFNKSDGLAYSIETPDVDYPEVFDPVILAVMEPKPKDTANLTESERKVKFAFEKLEDHLIGGFGIGMKRFDPRNLMH